MKNLFYSLFLTLGLLSSSYGITKSPNKKTIDPDVIFADLAFKDLLLSASSSNTIAKSNISNGLYTKIDTDNSGTIQESEANRIIELTLPYNSFNYPPTQPFPSNNILSFVGLSKFTNLKYFECMASQATTIDFAGNINLKSIYFNDSKLTSINLSLNTQLTDLGISKSLLTSLDISQNTLLERLNFNDSQATTLDINNINLKRLYFDKNSKLTSLNASNSPMLYFISCDFNSSLNSIDVAGNTKLTEFYCKNGILTTLNLSSNNELVRFSCDGNRISQLILGTKVNLTDMSCVRNLLTSLNTSSLPALKDLSCVNNKLTSLDLSSNSFLTYLNCSYNMITSINLKNGINHSLQGGYFNSNSNQSWGLNPLQYVCIDPSEQQVVQGIIATSNLSNVVLNSFCTFTPGGGYNTITGNVRMIESGTDCSSPTAYLVPNFKLNYDSPSNIVGIKSKFTYSSGNYKVFTTDLTGNVITPSIIENPTFFNITPVNATISFPNLNNNVTTQDFCISAIGVKPDLEVIIVPRTPARPGFDATYDIIYRNKGNQTRSGNVNFTYNATLLSGPIYSQTPTSSTPGNVNWSYVNLKPFETRKITVSLTVNAPTATPPVNIGQILNFTATIDPITGDLFPADNVFTLNQTVVGSFDPNEIICLQGDSLPIADANKKLLYRINCENTGTFPTSQVVITDVIDATKYDISTLEVLDYTIPGIGEVVNNEFSWKCNPAVLPPGGKGSILIRIAPKSGITVGTVVSQKANIFFDYNFPVVTNTASTTYTSLVLSIKDNDIDQSVGVYPNPAQDFVNVNATSNIKTIEVFDVQGRVIQTKIVSGNETKVDLTNNTKGIYFLKIKTDFGFKIEKIIKE